MEHGKPVSTGSLLKKQTGYFMQSNKTKNRHLEEEIISAGLGEAKANELSIEVAIATFFCPNCESVLSGAEVAAKFCTGCRCDLPDYF